MTGLRPHTKSLSQSERDALGLAVVRAREEAGWSRPAFSRISRVGMTSLWKLETGNPVGPSVYEAAARALPGWDEDTPMKVAKGSPRPAGAQPVDELPHVPAVASLDPNLPFDKWPAELQEKYAYLDEKVQEIGIPHLTPRFLRIMVDQARIEEWLAQAPVREGTIPGDDRQ